MHSLRASWRLCRVSLHLLHGMIVAGWHFRRVGPAGRAQRIQWWSARLIQLLGVQWSVQGSLSPGAKLVVANHVSWLDIAAIHATCPEARFVSKADVRAWPLLGWLVGAVGTLFIERERKRDAMRVVHQMADALAAGDTVAVFPEGTTSDGGGTLPFHANLLQAAISVEAPVQPVVLRFSDPGHDVSPAALFIGDTTLLQSIWALAGAQGLRVRVTVLPPLPTSGAERRSLAMQLRSRIDAVLHDASAVAGSCD